MTAPRRRVFVVDDHAMLRHGLRKLFEDTHDLVVCGEASGAAEALQGVRQSEPDLVLLDLSLSSGSGLDLVKDLRSRHPELPILVISMHEESIYAERVLRAGARGFVGKHEGAETLLAAIRRVLSGTVHVSPSTVERLVGQLNPPPGPRPSVGRLSDRELVVFELIGRGKATRQIAQELHVSAKTVDAHRAHIKAKLGLKSGAELVQHAIEWVRSRADQA